MTTRHEVLGTIRRVSGVWEVLLDASHGSVGIASVSTSGLDIRVDFDFVADRILTGAAGADETLVKSGVNAGPSMAVDHMLITLGKNNVQISQATISNPLANIWIDCKLESD